MRSSQTVAELIEKALLVRYGQSLRVSTSYNISICSTGPLRVEALKNYIDKCGIMEPYELRYPMIDEKSDAFPAKGRFVWAKAKGEGLFSNKIRYLPEAEDKEWIKQKLIQKYGEDPTVEAAVSKPGSSY